MIVGVAAVGLVLRLWRLDGWPLAVNEYFTLAAAEGWARPERADVTNRLMVCGSLLPRLFVTPLQQFWQDDLLALRWLPCIAGVLAIPLVGALVRRMWGAWAGLTVAFLISLSPLHVYYSSLGSFPALAFFLGGLGALCVLWVAASDAAFVWAWLGALLFGLGAGFHVTTLLPLVALVIAIVVLGPRRSAVIPLVVVLLAYAGATGLSVGWSAMMESVESTWQQSPIAAPHQLLFSLFHDLGLNVPILALLGAGFGWRRADHRVRLLVVTTMLSLGFAMGLSRLVPFSVHEMAGVALLLIVLAAMGFAEVAQSLPGLITRAAFVVVAFVPAVPALLSSCVDNSRYDVPTIASVLSTSHRAGELVFAESHALTQYYSGIPCQELPQTAVELEERLPSDERAFVVLLLQRGRVIGTRDPELQRSVEGRLRLLRRTAPKRFDMHRFETRLYVWDPGSSP